MTDRGGASVRGLLGMGSLNERFLARSRGVRHAQRVRRLFLVIMSNQAAPTVLPVDDDRDSRETLVEWAQRQGWESIAVKDGSEALQHIHDGVAVIVTDLKMPRTDGMELLRLAKQQATHAAVIMISLILPTCV